MKTFMGCLLAAVTVLGWSVQPAVTTVYAMLRLCRTEIQVPSGPHLDRRLVGRAIQREFLAKNVYIPMEDITIDDSFLGTSARLTVGCANASSSVWVAVPFRYPLGIKVMEWCLSIS